MTETLTIARYAAAIIRRELETVKAEIVSYPDDASVWATPPGIANSAGTLALHLAGNLSAYVGAQLGKTGYVRDRDREFAARDLPRSEILKALDGALDIVESSLAPLSDADLHGRYPLAFGDTTLGTGDFLIHLVSHLGYHLGQIDYHRRLTVGGPSVKALPIPKLASVESSS